MRSNNIEGLIHDAGNTFATHRCEPVYKHIQLWCLDI